jgi:hypothetical protein
VDYAYTALLKEGHLCLKSGGSIRLLAVVSPSMEFVESSHSFVPWTNQLKEKLLRKSKGGRIHLHRIPQIKDFETVQTVLECLPKSYDFECCLICFDLDYLSNFESHEIGNRLCRMVDKIRKAERVCAFVTPPPIYHKGNAWELETENDEHSRVLAEIREVANGLRVPYVDLHAMWKVGIGLKALKEKLIVDVKTGLTHYGHAIIADQLWKAFSNLKEQPLRYSWLD